MLKKISTQTFKSFDSFFARNYIYLEQVGIYVPSTKFIKLSYQRWTRYSINKNSKDYQIITYSVAKEYF